MFPFFFLPQAFDSFYHIFKRTSSGFFSISDLQRHGLKIKSKPFHTEKGLAFKNALLQNKLSHPTENLLLKKIY